MRTVTVIAIFVIVALAILAQLMGLFYKPTCGQSHPDYDHYAEALNRVHVSLSSRRGITDDDAIELSELNGGDWKVACVFGGYTNPLENIRALGSSISEEDQACLTEAGSRGFRLAQVDESEMVIAYVDHKNRAGFIHFNSGIGGEGQHFQTCILKPRTRLPFAGP